MYVRHIRKNNRQRDRSYRAVVGRETNSKTKPTMSPSPRGRACRTYRHASYNTLARATRLRTHTGTNSSLSLLLLLPPLILSSAATLCGAIESSLEPAVSCVTPRCTDARSRRDVILRGADDGRFVVARLSRVSVRVAKG